MFSSIGSASTTNGQREKVQIQIAVTDTVFSKNDLIKKFHQLFPNKFDFVTNSDFHMSSGHHYPDDTMRYQLSFSKTVNGKQIYGHIGFVGEDLEVEQFSYQPPNEKEALFPRKVSKDAAEKIAENVIKQFSNGEDYQLETDNSYNYYSPQILTQPIRYSFSFVRMKNKVAIADQGIQVTVLGNGEVVEFYRNANKMESPTFDDVNQVKAKNAMLEQVKDKLSVELQYQVNTDYQTGKNSVHLVYKPTAKLLGVHALSGKWQTTNGFSADFPAKTKIEKIAESLLPPRQNGITLEEAKKFAEQVLKIQSDKVKLSIHSLEELENYMGQEVISVQYSYEFGNGGHGASLEINKKTGEITQYYDVKGMILAQMGEQPKNENALSIEQATTQAIKYLKEWVPSYLHNYAKPIDEPYIEEGQGSYHFNFPRIVNGVVVSGDNIGVGIAADGSLSSLNVNYQDVETWPSLDGVVSTEEATAILKNSLSLKLNYIKQENKEDKHHYELVYSPIFNDNANSFLDAKTGKWNSSGDEKNTVVISHPTAQEELNYLINAKILDIKEAKNFNGDASISKGEALKVLIKSLTYFYEGGYAYEQESMNQTFENIDSKHPLYQVIERAVTIGILDAKNPSFNPDSPITREELAAWYIRVLGLEQAAKHSNIYKLDFVDANKVKPEYAGYVAITNSLGILKTDQNQFYPGREVTYAELAVSTIRLAYELAEKGTYLNY